MICFQRDKVYFAFFKVSKHYYNFVGSDQSSAENISNTSLFKIKKIDFVKD